METRAKDTSARPVLVLVDSLSPAPGTGGVNQAWLITFTDLVALLITFFVMLFAMSQVEERKWENLTRALSDNLDVVREVTVALPPEDLGIEPVETLPGVDLDYLATLLRQSMEAEAELADGFVTRLSDRLVISLPADLLFAPGRAALEAAGERAVFALGGLFRHIDNRIEVAGHADPQGTRGRYPSNWELSLDRALAVARMLREAGHAGQVTARGHGESHFAQLSPALAEPLRLSLARRVDVIIHEDAGELGP